jgi:thymidylate kinase
MFGGRRGKLIAFSGIDGAGKSTQIGLLIDELKRRGEKPVYYWSRGGYTGPFLALKSGLRKILGKRLPSAGRSDSREKAFQGPFVLSLWLALAMADLILVYGVYIRFLSLTGKVVLADRYLWDTWVDFRLNFPESRFDQGLLWRVLCWVSPKPDRAFLFIVPVEEALRRSALKDEPFPDSAAVLSKRLELYTTALTETIWHRIDGLQPVAAIQKEIQKLAIEH